ncbi:GFA family protein [Novosphingobium sp.]|uniref:GFA family protein n=1 Tax=Novosphingobium sp. TaxID=1874826 RepID=UPI00286B13B2|nr:GFA family protein [Novosphingobium sp.]
MTKTGGCLCGAVRYEVSGDPAMQLVCHCSHCQKQAGSAFSTIAGVPERAMTVTLGAPVTFIDHGESGQPVERQFCGTCGSPLFSKVMAAPGMVFIKTGTLDDSSWFKPSAHIWTKSKQSWVDLGDVPAFKTNPG